MSVRIDATGDQLLRTANLPLTTAFTVCGWGIRKADTGNYTSLASICNSTSGASQELNIQANETGDTFGLYTSATGFVQIGTTVLANDVPFFWAITASGSGASAITGYYREATSNVFVTATAGGLSFTNAAVFIGNNSYGEHFNGELWNIKCWDRTLTAAELLVESFYWRVMFPSSLNFWWPIRNTGDYFDYSGNARAPTVGGTLANAQETVGLLSTRKKIYIPAATGGGGGGGTTNTKQIDDVLSLSESISKRAYLNRVISNTVELFEESVFKETVFAINDSVSVTDAQLRAAVRGRFHGDSIALNDTLTRAYYAKRLINETVSLTETLAKSVLFSRRVQDTLALSELLTGNFVSGIGAGTVFTKVIADTVELVDVALRIAYFNRRQNEQIIITDSLLSSALRKAIIANSVSVTDAQFSSATRGRIYGDVVSLFESVSQSVQRGRVVDDSVEIADVQIRRLYLTRMIDDVVSMVDALVGLFVSNDSSRYDVRARIGVDYAAQAVIGATRDGMPVLGGYSS